MKSGKFLLTLMLAMAALNGRAVADFNHSVFNTILGKAVRSGRVDYAMIRADATFTTYLKSLETAQVTSLNANEKLAFYINAYNACVIKNVLNNPGMHKPTDVKGFFDAKKFLVAGTQVTLNDIENKIIRPTFNEPLVHFGLVCAARSCPALISKAYTGLNVRQQLAANAKSYLASGQNKWDPAKKSLSLSKIFEWYKADFKGDAGIRTFVGKYGTAAMIKGLKENPSAPVTYLEYDWTLNSK